MRNVIVSVNVTVDGFISGPAGELDWMIDDPVSGEEYAAALVSEVDLILSGRSAYEGFQSFFGHTAAAPETPESLRAFARWMTETPALVFSRTQAGLAADPAEAVAKARTEPGKDMVLFGGTSTVQHFVLEGLVDEFWLKVHPVVLGAGRPLFPAGTARQALALHEGKVYESGMTIVRYRVPGRS